MNANFALGLAMLLAGCGQVEQGASPSTGGKPAVAADAKLNQNKTDEFEPGTTAVTKKAEATESRKLAMAAYTALRKVEAMIEVGVRVVDYRRLVGETWFEVKLFLESPEAASNPKVTDGIRATMLAYKHAGAIWNLQTLVGKRPTFYFDGRDRCLGSENIMSYKGCEELGEVKQQLPQFDLYRDAPSRVDNELYKNTFYAYYDLSRALQDQWREAMEHLAEVRKLL